MSHPWSILFAGKKNDEHTAKALHFLRKHFSKVTCYLGEWGDPFPTEMGEWEGELIVSYLSRWIIPKPILELARLGAINFHPAPPEYPGIGCNNLALYEEAKTYGVTCHHMATVVDTGAIIAVKRFPIFEADDVSSLLSRTYDYQLTMFYDVLGCIIQGRELPVSEERWKRPPITRREFQQIGTISPSMPKAEVAKRIRATNYGGWKPTMEFHGFTFELKNDAQHDA